jgi:hypothetical protein
MGLAARVGPGAGPAWLRLSLVWGRDLVRERLAASPVGGAVCLCGAKWGVLA